MSKTNEKQPSPEQQFYNLEHFVDTAFANLHEMNFTMIYQDPKSLQAYRDLQDNLAEIEISIKDLKSGQT